jgi:hypothetical protein
MPAGPVPPFATVIRMTGCFVRLLHGIDALKPVFQNAISSSLSI